MRFSQAELVEILKAYGAITLAFGILLWRGYQMSFASSILISGVSVGAGFVFHELSHKFVAQRYGCWAEFRSYTPFLLLAIAMSFFGFVFAAPGAVYIRGNVTKERNGKISAAGIVANLIAAAFFLIVYLLADSSLLKNIGSYGLLINSWLGLFNLIPFWNFDGEKIFRWSRLVFGCLAAAGFALLIARIAIVP